MVSMTVAIRGSAVVVSVSDVVGKRPDCGSCSLSPAACSTHALCAGRRASSVSMDGCRIGGMVRGVRSSNGLGPVDGAH
jgi:hypothetical protein